MNTWETVELMGYAYYSNKGYRILVALIDTSGFDFVAYKDNEYIRVNVKKAGLKSRTITNSWCIPKASGAKTTPTPSCITCDVYLAWLPEKEEFLELDGTFFIGVSSKSRIIPKALYR